MNDSLLLNPNGLLLPKLAAQLFEARKTKPIWAKRIETHREVETLEGRVLAGPDDYLCRGILGEHWPQKFSNLLEKYVPSGEFDSDGWQRFHPRQDSEPVQSAEVAHAFRVNAKWGELSGKPGDYVVRSKTDPTDIWIVDKAIFEASYAREDSKK